MKNWDAQEQVQRAAAKIKETRSILQIMQGAWILRDNLYKQLQAQLQTILLNIRIINRPILMAKRNLSTCGLLVERIQQISSIHMIGTFKSAFRYKPTENGKYYFIVV